MFDIELQVRVGLCWFVLVCGKNLFLFLEKTMRKAFIIGILVLFVISGVSAQMTVSGILDTTVSMNAGAGDSPAFSMGFEEYANLRFQARLRERGTINGAFNFIAASGDYALGLAAMGYPIGENFVAAIELERLQFRLRGEHIDMDGGLFRLPFGYGQVWGPSDFLNPRNPLKPDARPRGILGTAITWYPIDELKLLAFYAAPRDALSNEGKGSLVGLSMDQHWNKVSVQGLYSYETPNTGSDLGIHRIGLSVKADMEAGFVIDALYTYNHEDGTGLDGLSISAGVDYSFFEGNVIAIVEYLYNGEKSATAFDLKKNMFGSINKHNLYTGLTWRFNDFTNLSTAAIFSFDDYSVTPVLTFNHDLFQGAVLTIMLMSPNIHDISDSKTIFLNCTARIRLRF
jgi:hypothetical protein